MRLLLITQHNNMNNMNAHACSYMYMYIMPFVITAFAIEISSTSCALTIQIVHHANAITHTGAEKAFQYLKIRK